MRHLREKGKVQASEKLEAWTKKTLGFGLEPSKGRSQPALGETRRYKATTNAKGQRTLRVPLDVALPGVEEPAVTFVEGKITIAE